MLSNIVLYELDKELEKRGLWYSRWAYDFVILVKTERSAKRVKEGITKYIIRTLGLLVNEEKSEVAEVKEITFLGFQIQRGRIRISDKCRLKFKEKVKSLTCRNNPLSMYQIIQDLNSYLRGWKTYFQIQEFKYPLRDLDGWIRSRLRSMR